MGTHNSLLQGIIFDMDGVLVDSEEYICAAAMRMFAETYGVQVQPEDFKPFVGAGENRYIGGVAEKHGIDWDLERDKKHTYDIYLDIIHGELDPLPGVREFIAECRRRGLKLAVASSADSVKVAGNLREIGIAAETFDVCLTGCDVEHKKPHPEIFLTAAERLGLAPAQCLVVEDAENGVKAGKAAGSPTLGLTTSFTDAQLAAVGADWTAPDLAHVPTAVYERMRGA